jgi:aryl-alcohol dehydrogenase-like predicted oxidoreductase
MEYTTLGKSSLQISRIGFGCMSLVQKEISTSILEKAVDVGINYFDTADLYDKGLNEELVGNTLKGIRNKVVLATKVGNVWRQDGSGWDWNASKSYILKAVESSLQRLRTDYIDLYQLHGGTIDDPIDEAIEAFELLMQQGKIRYYGISSIRPNVIREWVNRSNIASVMLQYSLLDRRPEEGVLPLLVDKGISVLTRGSVAQGLLVDKPAKPYLDYTAEQVATQADAVKSISSEQRKPVHIALQAVLQNAAVSAAVVGIRTAEQLQDAVQSIESHPLKIEERNFLLTKLPINYYKDHR